MLKSTVFGVLAVLFIVMSGFSVPNALAANSAALDVTQITAVHTYATADNTFTNGWKWVFDVTVPTDQTFLQMKFADWLNGSSVIPADSNIRIYSEQSLSAPDEAHAISMTASSTWSDIMQINPDVDLNALQGGRQIEIIVEARIPTGSAGGSYSTSYGIDTTATSSIALSDLTQAYDSTSKSVTVTTDPVGLATDVTYDGSTTLPVNAGTYTVMASVTDPDYTGTTTGVFTIDPASVTVTADPQTKTYDGVTATDPALTYVAAPDLFSGDVFSGTLSRDPGEDVGTYNITQGTLVLDSNYVLTFVPEIFVITPATSTAVTTATVTLGNLNQTYGSASSATVTTDPAGLATNITYDGSTTVPINTGTYAVVATITDPNYTGTASGSLIISPAHLTITAKDATKTYGDAVTLVGNEFTHSALVSGDSITSVSLTSVGVASTSPVSGSPYPIVVSTATGTGMANYDISYVNGNLTVNPKTLTTNVTANNKQYDGNITATTSGCSLNGVVNGDPTNCTVTSASFNNENIGTDKTVTANVSLSGDTSDYSVTSPIIATADITPLAITVTAQPNTKVYDGGTTATATPTISPSLAPGDTGSFTESYNSPDIGTGITLTPSGTVSDGNGGLNYTVTFDPENVGVITAAPVTTISVTGATLDQHSLNLTIGGSTGTLVSTVAPADATNKAVTWSSSDPSVATVANGIVTPIAAGSTTITVTTMDGSFTDMSIVTVVAPAALSSITVTTPPTTIDYTLGALIAVQPYFPDLTGLVVTGTYSDGSTRVETITITEVTFETLNIGKLETATYVVTVDGKTTTFDVNVTSN